MDAVKDNNLNRLLNLNQQFVENAKPDSIWQIAILIGVLEQAQLQGTFISYEAPTYYGMLCAAYTTKRRAP